MKARTPIMANKTMLDWQLHSSGPKMIRVIKVNEVIFVQYMNLVDIVLSLHDLDRKDVNRNRLNTNKK